MFRRAACTVLGRHFASPTASFVGSTGAELQLPRRSKLRIPVRGPGGEAPAEPNTLARQEPRPPESRASPVSPCTSAPAPEALGAPDAGPQALQLHDLAVVHEQVHLRAVGLDVPGEHLRVGRLEHHPLQPQLVHDPGRPRRSASAVTFSVIPSDSIMIRYAPASRQRRAWPIAQPGVARALGLQLRRRAGAAGAELDADLRLRLQPGRCTSSTSRTSRRPAR